MACSFQIILSCQIYAQSNISCLEYYAAMTADPVDLCTGECGRCEESGEEDKARELVQSWRDITMLTSDQGYSDVVEESDLLTKDGSGVLIKSRRQKLKALVDKDESLFKKLELNLKKDVSACVTVADLEAEMDEGFRLDEKGFCSDRPQLWSPKKINSYLKSRMGWKYKYSQNPKCKLIK